MSPTLRSRRAVGGDISVRTFPTPNHRTRTGCHNCRLRRKKCDGPARRNAPCGHCDRLSLQCLGYGDERPDWMRKHGSQLQKAMRRHIKSKANKVFSFESYYQKHAWCPSFVREDEEPLGTTSSASVTARSTDSVDSSNSTTSDDESEEDTVGYSSSPHTPTSSQLSSPVDEPSSSPCLSPTFSFRSTSSASRPPSPAESIQPPHPISIADTDNSTSILLNATPDEEAPWDPDEPDHVSVPQKCPSPSASPDNPLLTQDGDASARDTDLIAELEEWIYYPEVSTVTNEGAITVGCTSTGTLEPFNTVPQAVDGDSVRNWVQQLPAQDAALGSRHEETRVSDPHYQGTADSLVQAYLDYIESICASTQPGPSTNNVRVAQGTSYTCSAGPEQEFASLQYAGTNYGTYSLPRAINDYLAAYFARLNPAVSPNQCPCQGQSAGTSAHELSTVLAFVQGLPERVGWSLDINVIHQVIQQWGVFDQGQPIASPPNLQPADHEMYALLAMFGVAFDLLKGGAGSWEWYLNIACDWFRTFYLSLSAGHSLLCLGTSKVLGELIMWMDILGSVTRRGPPYLSDIYSEIEGLGGISPFRLEDVMGCSNSVMFGIARISELSCRKAQEAASGGLSNATLCQTADAIRARYLYAGQNVMPSTTHPTLLGNLCGLLPFASPSASHLDYLGSGVLLPQSSPLSTSTITEAYRLSALVYLQTVVSGPLPSSQEVTSAACEAVSLLHYRVPPTEMDRCLIFPFFVTACTSLGDQRIAIGRRLYGVNCAETVGNGRNALVVVKELWRHLDSEIPVDWCQIMEQQYRRVLLA